MMETRTYERVLLLKAPVHGGCDQSIGNHLVGKPDAEVGAKILGREMSWYETLRQSNLKTFVRFDHVSMSPARNQP